MADEAQAIRSINWREVFPFTNLFRAFRIAVHPSKLILALIALLLVYFGGRLLDAMWPDVKTAPLGLDFFHPGVFMTFFGHQVIQVNKIVASVLGGSLIGIIDGTVSFFITGPVWMLRNHPFFFILFMAWFLLVWSVFGGAIARIAAVHVARDEKISVRQALRFSTSKVLSFMFAPLIPLLIILFIAVVVAIGGLLFYIPWINIIAAAFFILALIAGCVMALVLVGTVGGFNLMYPTIAVEGSDSFDAISRSFSYVFARPWRMLFYTLIAIIYGALTYLFVRFFILVVLLLTHGSASWFLGENTRAGRGFEYIWPTPGSEVGLSSDVGVERLGAADANFAELERMIAATRAPQLMPKLTYVPGYDNLKTDGDISAGLISMWVYLLIGLLGAYAISYYFSVNTIIYFLMRREVDATDLDDVYVEDADDEFGEAAARPLDAPPAAPAPAAGTTSAPGGGVTGTAGSADPGGGATRPYTAPPTDAPPATPPPASPPPASGPEAPPPPPGPSDQQ